MAQLVFCKGMLTPLKWSTFSYDRLYLQNINDYEVNAHNVTPKLNLNYSDTMHSNRTPFNTYQLAS